MKRSTSRAQAGQHCSNITFYIKDVSKWKGRSNPSPPDSCHPLFHCGFSLFSVPAVALSLLPTYESALKLPGLLENVTFVCQCKFAYLIQKGDCECEEVDSTMQGLEGYIETLSFLLSIPLVWHKSHWWRNHFIGRYSSGRLPAFCFSSLFVACGIRAQLRNHLVGNPSWISPLARFLKTLATAQWAPSSLWSHWLWTWFLANPHFVIRPEFAVWLTSRPKQHHGRLASHPLWRWAEPSWALYSLHHITFSHFVQTSLWYCLPQHTALCSLWQGEYCQGIIY